MLFNSFEFFVFLAITVGVFYMLPHKLKNIFLLIVSYVFYMKWNVKYGLMLLICTLITYLVGMVLKYEEEKRKRKIIFITTIVSLVAVLVLFKYTDFIIRNMNFVLQKIGVGTFNIETDILLPVGISFTIFQLISYVVDVYKGKIAPEENFIIYALFVSYFPKITQGPIERGKDLFFQLYKRHSFDFENIKFGVLQFLWGLWKKMVIADRLGYFVNAVFNNYTNYSGVYIVIATFFYTIQIYCDFSGYSDMARGVSKLFGICLSKNFEMPYFATSVSDFWRRWHISLTSWLRDYVYIPLGGSRCGRVRKNVNLMITFLVSGMWHGSSWNFIFWGGLNGIYQIIGRETEEPKRRLCDRLGIRRECESYKLAKILVTFLLTNISWLFFRAPGFKAALSMIKQVITNFNFASLFKWQSYGFAITGKEVTVCIVAISVLFIIEFIQTKKDLFKICNRQNVWAQWGVYYALLLSILIFGVYGSQYDAGAFIYSQF